MVIGVVKLLQEYGYNKGDFLKIIFIVGVDVILDVKEFIDKGEMFGFIF